MNKNSNDPQPNESSLRLLKALGVLDSSNQITPEAYIGYVMRLPVNEQAQALGIPLIVLPPPRGEDGPEKVVTKFFSRERGLHVDGGYEESYLLRSFITSVVSGFNARKKKHSITQEQIAELSQEISGLTEGQVIRRLEENNVVFQPHFGWAYSILMPESTEQAPYSMASLRSRFYKANCYRLPAAATNDLEGNKVRCEEYLRSKERAEQYARNMIAYLWLWRSLSPAEWASLVAVVLENWDKMASGWPDINVVSPEAGLILIEVKGKDKLHTSQVYTLLKLREVLGPHRVAIAWANRIAKDLPFDNSEHQESIWEWLRTPPEKRSNMLKHPEHFYCASKALLI
tara:strand:- start:371 stop:1402 length:1032 start_codon:yes stop_codon:yes gene_type:complete